MVNADTDPLEISYFFSFRVENILLEFPTKPPKTLLVKLCFSLNFIPLDPDPRTQMNADPHYCLYYSTPPYTVHIIIILFQFFEFLTKEYNLFRRFIWFYAIFPFFLSPKAFFLKKISLRSTNILPNNYPWEKEMQRLSRACWATRNCRSCRSTSTRGIDLPSWPSG